MSSVESLSGLLLARLLGLNWDRENSILPSLCVVYYLVVSINQPQYIPTGCQLCGFIIGNILAVCIV